MNDISRSARRRLGAAAATAFYFASLACAPLAHAVAEESAAGGAVEAEHSTICPTLHSDALCRAGTAPPMASTVVTQVRVSTTLVDGVPTLHRFAARRNPDHGPRRVRAPPSR